MRTAILLLGILPLAAGTLRAPQRQAPEGQRNENAEVAGAVGRALDILQSSQAYWTREVGCFSCHHQGLGALAVGVARDAGFEVDEELAEAQADVTWAASRDRYEALLVCDGVGVFGRGTTLLALAARGRPRDDVTDVVAHFLAARQAVSGVWYSNEHRPPFEDSHVTATALTLRSLQLYGPEGRAPEIEERLGRARTWLEDVRPTSSEERSMRLLGMAWAGSEADLLREAAAELLRLQRPDGGWAQIETLKSDAYATGQALVALHQGAAISRQHPAYRRGVRFLLRTQREDGTWLVRTRRRIKGLKQRDSGFPYGRHQLVSFMGSSWATMALALTRHEPAPTATLFGPLPGRAPDGRTGEQHGLTPLHRAAAFGTLEELRMLLADGPEPNAPGPKGVTPLMLAVHDPARVELLLEHGADPHAESQEWGFTPLLMASQVSGSAAVVEHLLELGASLDCAGANGSSPLMNVASTSDVALLRSLAAAGAEFPPSYLPLALVYAATCDDLETARALLELGADVDQPAGSFGTTPLTSAVIAGYPRFVELMLEAGADPEVPDPEGLSALAWAAKVDRGDARILERLLAAGADPESCAENGLTPLGWAEQHGNVLHARHLRAVLADSPDGDEQDGDG